MLTLVIILQMKKNKYKLTDELTVLPGVGPKISKLFENIKIKNIRDLIFYFPKYYKDYRNTKLISELSVNEEVTVKGKIISSQLIRARTRIYEVLIKDDTGQFKVIWFNPFYRYLKENFKVGSWAILSGKTSKSGGKLLQIVNPKPENVLVIEEDEELEFFARISSIYSLTKGLTQNRILSTLSALLKEVDYGSLDFFSDDIKSKYDLSDISDSISNIHQPLTNRDEPVVDLESSQSVSSSRSHRTFIFFEFLILCLGIKSKERSKVLVKGIPHKINQSQGLFFKIMTNFPFDLTDSQGKALGEILDDMRSEFQMNRLLQGDVGSGKTIIALLSMSSSYDNGYQSVLIAPTEILADQHYLYLKKYVNEEEIVILKSSLKNDQKKHVKERISSGSAKFIVGTHSLFQEDVNYKSLGIVVIDEQHRFGVLQRKLMSEKGVNPDILVMTATPIPRTLSNVFFTDYKVSNILEMPTNRGKITTKVANAEEPGDAYRFLIKQLQIGRQAFVLCPLIKKSDNEEFESLEDIESLYLELRKNKLKNFKLGIIHGRLKSEEKEEVMKKFRLKEIDVLISTTVIEVGVDVPNASIMMIYNPERFGLSQLHQLRGRIGRGPYDSTCILMVGKIGEFSKDRLIVFKNTLDGFLIAEKDMEMRGPGAFYGTGVEQSGKFWDLHLASLRRDIPILEEARICASEITKYDFYKNNNKCFDELILSTWGEKLNLTKVI